MENIQNQYYRLWVRQLGREFENICWQYNVDLRLPSFEISDSQRQVGVWFPDTRVIKISCQLIEKYSWVQTLAVLKHEMAHQICSEIFQSTEPSHGSCFKKACVMLGLPEEYRKASGGLPDLDSPAGPDTSEVRNGRRFLGKVEKLLALAQSSNENEASLAMAKAHELIEKYNLLGLDKEESRYTFHIINHKKKMIAAYQRHICRILQDFFYVRLVFSSLYDPQTDQNYKTIELLGAQENVTVAEYVYDFLEKQLAILWRQNRRKFAGRTRTEKNSYYLGLLKGFYDKLKAQSRAAAPVSTSNQRAETVSAMIVAGDRGLQEFAAARFPRLRVENRRSPKIYKETYQEGVKGGAEIVLHRGIKQEAGNLGLLLGR